MADFTSIDIEEAKQLKIDIENEFAQVEQILHNVGELCAADPAEDDTIMKLIEETGKVLEENWGHLADGFKHVTSALDNIINAFVNWIDKTGDKINDFKSKISL